MGYLDNVNWEKIKKELQTELEKGLAVLKNGVIVIQKKAEELTEEGKRQYKMLTTKARIHDEMRDLGAKVYILMRNARVRNPALNPEVKVITARIKSLEAELAKLEGRAGAAPVPATRAKARRRAAVPPRHTLTRRVKINNPK